VQQAILTSPSTSTSATQVRSTLLQLSLRGVRSQGNFQRWEAFVEPEYRELILESIAPSWLPIEAGLAHYLACDRFGLDDEALEKIGMGVGAQLQSTLLGMASKIAASMVTQDLVNQQFMRLWPRLVQGGNMQITHRGKEVTIELRGAVLSKSRYFRGTLLGNVRAGSALFGQKLTYLRAASYDERSDHYVVQLGH
jgi:hypothetical protein